MAAWADSVMHFSTTEWSELARLAVVLATLVGPAVIGGGICACLVLAAIGGVRQWHLPDSLVAPQCEGNDVQVRKREAEQQIGAVKQRVRAHEAALDFQEREHSRLFIARARWESELTLELLEEMIVQLEARLRVLCVLPLSERPEGFWDELAEVESALESADRTRETLAGRSRLKLVG